MATAMVRLLARTYPSVVPHLISLPLEARFGQCAREGALGRWAEVVDGELLESVDLPLVLSVIFQRRLSGSYDSFSSLCTLLCVHGLREEEKVLGITLQ